MLRLILAACLLVPVSATAQELICAPRDVIIGALSEKYEESRQTFGTAGALVVEIYANPETGSWTLVSTDTDGKSCLTASGQNFEKVDDPLVPTGSKT